MGILAMLTVKLGCVKHPHPVFLLNRPQLDELITAWSIHEGNLKRKTLQEFIDAHVQEGSTVECDGYQAYNGLKNVAVDAKVYDCTSGDLMWLHKALSNLKALMTGASMVSALLAVKLLRADLSATWLPDSTPK